MIKEWYKKTALTMFVHDWGKYTKEQKIEVKSWNEDLSEWDVKVVHPGNMPITECTKLNRLLGLRSINCK